MNHKNSKSQGFTLLEILLVVGIIAILAGIVIVAINPSKQLATVRNTERKSDIKQIDSAIQQYYIDHGHYPTGLTSTLQGICNTGTASSSQGITCTNLLDLSALVPDYIPAIPADPTSTTTDTGYYVKEDSTTHKIGTRATLAELEQDININAASGTPSGGGGSTLGDGLVAHYTFNDNVNDSVGSHNGTWSGTPSYVSSQSGMGKAGSFNGNSKITFGTGINLGNIASITFWIKSVPSDVEYIIGGDSSTHSGTIATSWSNSHKLGGCYGSCSWYDFSNLPDIADGNWHFVAVIFNNGSGTAIVGGNLTTFTYTNSPVIYYELGTDNNTQYFNGQLDDVRFYNKALTQTEISELAAGTEAE